MMLCVNSLIRSASRRKLLVATWTEGWENKRVRMRRIVACTMGMWHVACGNNDAIAIAIAVAVAVTVAVRRFQSKPSQPKSNSNNSN